MTVFKARRTGIAVPCENTKEPFVKSDSINFVKSDSINDEQFFDMVGIPVPKIKDQNFPDWHREFTESTDGVLEQYIKVLRDITGSPEQTT